MSAEIGEAQVRIPCNREIISIPVQFYYIINFLVYFQGSLSPLEFLRHQFSEIWAEIPKYLGLNGKE